VHLVRSQSTSLRARPKRKQIEPFNFEPLLADHCETPGNALRHIAPLLRQVSQRLYPEEEWRASAKKLRIYDPYYCQGNIKKRLNKLGFEDIYNENVDFYQSIREGTFPEFDVVVTNPPFTEKEHLSAALEFAIDQGKPWFMVFPTMGLFYDHFVNVTESIRASDRPPMYIFPRKKYNFKTPPPFPPPPTKNRALARTRSKLTSTLWCVHGCADPEMHDAILSGSHSSNGLADCRIIADLEDIPSDMVPRKFSDEMMRNAKLFGVLPPDETDTDEIHENDEADDS